MRSGLRALVLALLLLGVLGSASARAASQTVITFDGPAFAAGTQVTDQYEAEGLKLGTAASFGQSSPGEGDCGAPSVQDEVPGSSAPNYALLKSCGPVGAVPSSGTYGALLKHPKGSLSVEIRDLAPDPALGTTAKISLTGYGSSGNALAQGEGVAVQGSWTKLTAIQVGGTNAQISYFSIRTASATEDPIGIDDLSFEKVEEEVKKEEEGKKEEGKKEEPGGGGGGSGGGSTPAPPTAVLTLETPNPHKGEAITLSGAGSQPGSGRIISYGWDFNNDGKIDTSTGTNPIAHLILTPGDHTVALTVTNTEGKSSTSRLGIAIPSLGVSIPKPDGGEGECQSSLTVSFARLVGECVQTVSGGYVIETKLLELNGMVFAPKEGGFGVFHVQKIKRLGLGTEWRLSGPAVNVELLNTPVGDVVLGGYDLEHEPIELGLEAFNNKTSIKLASSFGLPMAHAAGSKGLLLMSLGAGHECEKGGKEVGCCPPEKGTTSCATLPGNFPIAGQVIVYVNGKGEVLIDVQVSLNLHELGFEASGELEIVANLETGIDLGSMKFEVPEASLAQIFKVKKASFQYYFPEDPDVSKRDSWEAKAQITFAAIEEAGIEGSLSFKKGAFHSASLVLSTGSVGIPIYPGILLNKFGGSVAVEPLAFGGTLGASIATQLELTLEFRYAEPEGEKLGYFGGKGSLSFHEDEIASLAADVYSDGYVDAQLKIDIKLPIGEETLAEASGELGFWDEPSSGLWEAKGNVKVKIWELNAEVAGLINNKFLAACGSIAGVGAYDDFNIEESKLDGPGFFVLKDCSDQLKKFTEKPKVEHKGGFIGEGFRFNRSFGVAPIASASATGEETVTLPKGELGEEFKIISTSGTPIVTFTSPTGQTFTTPGTRGVSHSASYVAALGNSPDEVIVLLPHPQSGTWRIAEAPGSAPVGEVLQARDLPPARIHAATHRAHGHSWKLAYKIGNYLAGTHVTFVEHGKDSTHVLGTVSKAKGTINFTPQEGLSRPRTITAALTNAAGATIRVITVGHYKAPSAFRPRRARHVKFARHASSATLTWGSAAGARLYRVKVQGSDGRLETFFAKPGHLSEQIPNVLPFESFKATVIAVGGKDLLPGPAAKAKLAAVKKKTKKRARTKKKH